MIPKTPGERISAAEHAIRTKQHRLANLYMNLASEELEERRIERMTPLERGLYDFTEGMSAVASLIEKAYSETIIPALQRMSEDFDSLSQNMNEHETETR